MSTYGYGYYPGFSPGFSSPAIIRSGAPPVQAGTNGATAGSNINSQPFLQRVTAGNFMVFYIFDLTDSSTTISGIAWSGGGSGLFVPTPLSPVTTANRAMWCYTSQLTASLGTSVVVQFSASISSVVIYAEYGGLDPVATIDGEVANNGIGANLSSGTLDTTNAKDLLVGGLFVTTAVGGGVLSAGPGFTLQVNDTATGTRALEDQNVTVAGTYAATATNSTPQTWIAHLLALKRQ